MIRLHLGWKFAALSLAFVVLAGANNLCLAINFPALDVSGRALASGSSCDSTMRANAKSPVEILNDTRPSTRCARSSQRERKLGRQAGSEHCQNCDTVPCSIRMQEDESKNNIDERLDKAVRFLLSKQHANGCFSTGGDQSAGNLEKWWKDFRAGAVHPPRHSTAYTSLAIMSLAALGHLPSDESAEGEAMARAIDFIVEDRMIDENGYFGQTDHSRMYGHGITTLMLTEMVGMAKSDEQDQKIRKRAEAALNLILKAQAREKSDRHRGGWRYTPDAQDSDLSVTVWQLMALRSAKNAGFTVPKSSIDNAIKYLQVCYKSKRDEDGNPINLDSGFCYEPGRNPEFATTAAGLLALQVCGGYDFPEVEAASKFLFKKEMEPRENRNWFFYGIYYYAQGQAQRGEETASKARNITEELLCRIQKPDGSFAGRGEEQNPVYATSMAILSLSIQHHYLPIYQR